MLAWYDFPMDAQYWLEYWHERMQNGKFLRAPYTVRCCECGASFTADAKTYAAKARQIHAAGFRAIGVLLRGECDDVLCERCYTIASAEARRSFEERQREAAPTRPAPRTRRARQRAR